KILSTPKAIVGLAVSGDKIAFSIAAPPEDNLGNVIVVCDTRSQICDQIATQHTSWGELHLDDDLLAWGSGSGWGDDSQYLYSLADEDLYRLGRAPGAAVAGVAGDFVMWTEVGQGIVFDTRIVRWS